MPADDEHPALVFYPRVRLEPDARGRRSGCEPLAAASGTAWTGVVIHEWELDGEGWEDLHPHDETTYLLAGRLTVESDGVSVTLGPGDAALVRAGHVGRYLAAGYARMLAVYGPNPSGETSSHFRSWRMDATGPPRAP